MDDFPPFEPLIYRRRLIQERLLSALSRMPVAFLAGPRQAGKTTLVRRIGADPARRYLTLDDALTLEAAHSDPEGFIARLVPPVTIDEVQRVPQLFLAIKARVDRERINGQFLLTGSANVTLTARVADSLAGRMSTMTLWPLSQAEIEGCPGTFIDRIFEKDPALTTSGVQLTERIIRGGYPQAHVVEPPVTGLHDFIGDLVTSLLQRDIRDIASVDDIFELQRILRVLSARPASELNVTRLASDLGIPRATLMRYLRVLDLAFLTFSLPAWSGNATVRISRSPKAYLADTAIACYEAGVDRQRLENDPLALGHLTENFVASEIMKLASWSRSRVSLFHYRTHRDREVDLVLEKPNGSAVGIEVKASHKVTHDDLRGLNDLREQLGKRFVRGIVLYVGPDTQYLEDHIVLPISALWRN
ncbi:MAG TPA: ATP-binding protein [Candidatus Baltobacteraceae bacterium]|jgi:hypothetical protein|nr:ATP-binding protein [Candidatus Baltobacteraceae bacterium]